MIGGPFITDSSLLTWGRLHNRALEASRVVGWFWCGGLMSTSLPYIHSIMACLRQNILGYTLGPFTQSLKLFWHSRRPLALRWIVSPEARYLTTPIMRSCWLGIRSPLLWLSCMYGVGSRLYRARSSPWWRWPSIKSCRFSKYPGTHLTNFLVLQWFWITLTMRQVPLRVLLWRILIMSPGFYSPQSNLSSMITLWVVAEWSMA